MRVAHITPPEWVRIFPLGDYRMALAHWASINTNYTTTLTVGKGGYTILDNGAFEDEQQTNPMLNLAAQRIEADEVVLPDVPGDGDATLKRSWSAYRHFFSDRRVMFVPQGNDPKEWIKCLEGWIDNWNAKGCESYLAIGVPSLRDKNGIPIPGSKTETLQAAAKTGFPIHILGVADINYFATELLPLALELEVRGVDTSTAFALGAHDVLLTTEAEKIRLGDPKDYGALSTCQRRLIKVNRAILDYWCESGDTENGLDEYTIRKAIHGWNRYWARGFISLNDVLKSACVPNGRYEVFQDDDPNGQTRRYIRTSFGGKEIDVRDYTL